MTLCIMRNEDGKKARFKVRILAWKNYQIHREEYDKVYVAVASYSNWFLIMIIVLHYRWFMRHVNIMTALINVDLEQDVYVSHTCNAPWEMQCSSFYKVKRLLYGIRQAPIKWFKKLSGALTGLQFYYLKTDGYIFTKIVTVNDLKKL